MENFEPTPQKRTGLIIAIVVIGIGMLGAGGYLAWSKRHATGTADASPELKKWCELRQEWAREVVPLSGDIMLKSVNEKDKEEYDQLVTKRNKLCHQYAKRLQDLKITNPGIQAVEVALIKEGKVRANVAVEIYNMLAKLESLGTVEELNKAREKLKTTMARRIKEARKSADLEIQKALATLPGGCSKIYRGPATDAGTSGNPYVSWDELEMRRTTAIKKFTDRINELEPVEEFTNRVFHELVRKYRHVLTGCYKKIKAKNPDLSETMGLRIRLKKNGEVATLATEWMTNRDERLLDCLLAKAAKWRLPRPDPEMEVVVVSLDFSRL